MSQENVEIVRRVIDAQNRDDLAESVRLYSPEAEIDWSRSKGPLRGVYPGHVGIKTFRNELWTAFEDIRLDAHDFMASGSEVVVPNTTHLRGRDGIEVVARATFVYTVENRRVTRLRMFQEQTKPSKPPGCGSRAAPPVSLEAVSRLTVPPRCAKTTGRVSIRNVGRTSHEPKGGPTCTRPYDAMKGSPTPPRIAGE